MAVPRGYSTDICEDADDRYVCTLCNSILRKPMQGFCGHRFCQRCIIYHLKINPNSEYCPGCEQELENVDLSDENRLHTNNIYEDKACARDMATLQVHCGHHNCGWSGSLESYEEHVITRNTYSRSETCYTVQPAPAILPLNTTDELIVDIADTLKDLDADYRALEKKIRERTILSPNLPPNLPICTTSKDIIFWPLNDDDGDEASCLRKYRIEAVFKKTPESNTYHFEYNRKTVYVSKNKAQPKKQHPDVTRSFRFHLQSDNYTADWIIETGVLKFWFNEQPCIENETDSFIAHFNSLVEQTKGAAYSKTISRNMIAIMHDHPTLSAVEVHTVESKRIGMIQMQHENYALAQCDTSRDVADAKTEISTDSGRGSSITHATSVTDDGMRRATSITQNDRQLSNRRYVGIFEQQTYSYPLEPVDDNVQENSITGDNDHDQNNSSGDAITDGPNSLLQFTAERIQQLNLSKEGLAESVSSNDSQTSSEN